jgi:hypothetical protein
VLPAVIPPPAGHVTINQAIKLFISNMLVGMAMICGMLQRLTTNWDD